MRAFISSRSCLILILILTWHEIESSHFTEIWSHLISWKKFSSHLTRRSSHFSSVSFHLMKDWSYFMKMWFHLSSVSSHLISQKHDFILILTWNQNRIKYSDSDLIIKTIWCRKSRKCYQVMLSMLIFIISTSILKVKTILNKKRFSQLIFPY